MRLYYKRKGLRYVRDFPYSRFAGGDCIRVPSQAERCNNVNKGLLERENFFLLLTVTVNERMMLTAVTSLLLTLTVVGERTRGKRDWLPPVRIGTYQTKDRWQLVSDEDQEEDLYAEEE